MFDLKGKHSRLGSFDPNDRKQLLCLLKEKKKIKFFCLFVSKLKYCSFFDRFYIENPFKIRNITVRLINAFQNRNFFMKILRFKKEIEEKVFFFSENMHKIM